MTDREQLEQLIRRGHGCIAVHTFEEDYALLLVREAAVNLNRPIWIWSVSGGVQEGLLAGGRAITGTEDAIAGLTCFASLPDRPLCVTLDLAPHLRDDRTLRVLRNLLRRLRESGNQLILVDYREDLPAVVLDYATRFEVSLPDEEELEAIVRDTLRAANRERPIQVQITRSGLRTVVRNLRGLTRRQAAAIIADAVADDRRFDEQDINHVLAAKRQALQRGSLLEYVETPVDLAEIGGLERLKRWLAARTCDLDEQARAFGLAQPRGVLMLGVQGAGKSLCAKAIATAWQRPLLRMDVGALYDRYVGESERRLRESLRQAEAMAPIVLWIDEIEKAFASAASRSTDGGLSQRMFGALLTWMQERSAPVFLVATANDIEALPPELLRKGRFDEIFFVDLPGPQTRREIFAIHLRKRGRDPGGFDLAALAQAADGYSGAEIEQAVLAALHEAFAAKGALTTAHIAAALASSPPLSVTMQERVAALRAWATGRCVPAD
ncbi:MAG: AAA family ATPase [Planctomycetota bacterium]